MENLERACPPSLTRRHDGYTMVVLFPVTQTGDSFELMLKLSPESGKDTIEVMERWSDGVME